MTHNPQEDKPLKIVAKDDILTDILTLAVVIIVIGTTLAFVAPNFMSDPEIITDTTPTGEYQKPIAVEFSPVREPTEIESLINDLILHNPARKAQYAHHPDKVDEVHVCANMAVDQAEWIIGNYDYDVGIVMLWNKYLGDNHVQTWVDVNDTRYVIDSTSNYYWNVEKHESQWDSKYKIQYTTVKKGLELEKANNEMLNNKDEIQLPTVEPIIDITVIGNTDIPVGERTKFLIRVDTNMNTLYKLNVTIDDNVIYHGERRQFDRMTIIPITHVFITSGDHTISANIIFNQGDYESSDKITRTIVDNI